MRDKLVFLVDICFQNHCHSHLTAADEAFCFSQFQSICPSHHCCSFSVTILVNFTSSPPLFVHRVHFQMATKYLQIHREVVISLKLILNTFPSSLSHFSEFLNLTLNFMSPSLPLVQYQMEMMRSLRHVNIDHLHVGWYQSTIYGSFVSRALLDSQFSYQHAIEESVVLIYGE